MRRGRIMDKDEYPNIRGIKSVGKFCSGFFLVIFLILLCGGEKTLYGFTLSFITAFGLPLTIFLAFLIFYRGKMDMGNFENSADESELRKFQTMDIMELLLPGFIYNTYLDFKKLPFRAHLVHIIIILILLSCSLANCSAGGT